MERNIGFDLRKGLIDCCGRRIKRSEDFSPLALRGFIRCYVVWHIIALRLSANGTCSLGRCFDTAFSDSVYLHCWRWDAHMNNEPITSLHRSCHVGVLGKV